VTQPPDDLPPPSRDAYPVVPDHVPADDAWPQYAPPYPIAPPRPSIGRELLAAAAAFLGVAVAGALLGWVWSVVTPTTPLRVGEGGSLLYITAEPEQPVAADGWFALLGLGFGLLAAVAVWLLLRRWHGPVQMVALVLGAVAAGYLAHWIGMEIAFSRYDGAYADAAVGTIVQHPSDLRIVSKLTILSWTIPVRGSLLVPALGATLTYALVAGWSRWPSLRPHEEREVAAHTVVES
jgi:hypothetical protein